MTQPALPFVALLLTTTGLWKRPERPPTFCEQPPSTTGRKKSVSLTSKSRGDRRGTGTGDMQTQHTALLPLLLHGTNSSLPAGPTAALQTHLRCCVFYSHTLLGGRQDSSFSLTILSEETAQGDTRIACFARLCNNSLQLLGRLDGLTSAPISLHASPGRKGFGNSQMRDANSPGLRVRQLFKYCSCSSCAFLLLL